MEARLFHNLRRARLLGLLVGALCLGAAAVGTLPADEPGPVSAQAVFEKSVPASLADLQAMEQRFADLSEKVIPTTVGVRIGGAQGSGVIVSKEGHVLTAAHVSGAPGRNVTFILHDGRKVRGKTLGRYRTIDASLMQITDKGDWPVAKMAEDADLKIGAWCLATGHPGGYHEGRKPVVRVGRLILVRNTVLQTDCTLVGGDSGGPLFNMNGEVIGIHSRIGSSTEWNFHVPIGPYLKHWDRLVASEDWGGQLGRGAVLGVNGEDDPEGCRITGVAPGFPAEKADLQEGDIVTHVNGERIKGIEDLAERITAMSAGDKVKLDILRGDQRLEKTAVLVERE